MRVYDWIFLDFCIFVTANYCRVLEHVCVSCNFSIYNILNLCYKNVYVQRMLDIVYVYIIIVTIIIIVIVNFNITDCTNINVQIINNNIIYNYNNL